MQSCRFQLRKCLSKETVQDISITHAVPVLCRDVTYLVLKVIRNPYAYERVKDRLSCELPVFSDGTKPRLTIISTAKEPKSFPRHEYSLKELNIFYLSPKMHGTRSRCGVTSQIDSTPTRRCRDSKYIAVLDNASHHIILHSSFKSFDEAWLETSPPSHLHTMDACIGRSLL